MSVLWLARHGNTFATGEPSRWVGRKTDLELTEEGRQQSKLAGKFIQQSRSLPDVAFYSPLKRTSETARIMLDEIDYDITASSSEALLELDFGLWEGKTNQEVHEEFGNYLKRWKEKSAFPPPPIWNSTEEQIKQVVSSFCINLVAPVLAQGKSCLCVSSNGVLRFVLRHFLVLGQIPELGIRTGALGLLRGESNPLELVFWDKRPNEE